MFIEKVRTAVPAVKRRLAVINLETIQRHLGKLVVLIPMTLLIVYLVIFSQPRYVSESTVAIKRSSDIDGSSLNVGLLLGASNPSSVEDALYLKEYINSPDMLAILDKQLNFHEAYSHSGLDFFYHLPRQVTAEKFLDYYRNRIAVTWDDKTAC